KPVRPDDVRLVLERVASRASALDLAATPEDSSANGVPEEPAASVEPEPLPPPVDMERLLDFANGNPENLRELAELYLQQTSRQVEQLSAAVKAAAAEDVRRLAHSCAGASSTCGMTTISPILRELEHQAVEGLKPSSHDLARRIEAEFDRIRKFLEDYLKNQLSADCAKAKA